MQKIKAKGYQILIGNNILYRLPKEINKNCSKCKKVAIIIDKKVPNRFLLKIKKTLRKYEVLPIRVKSSEKIKNLNQSTYLINTLLKSKFNRSDVLISLGGGIVGDLTGFVASIFKRGINFINIPTTLLAQVDSCIGGKTGVNSSFGKNLIGSFYKPIIVISDTNFLKSLPKREIICGYAEILKHAIIKDRNFFNWLKKNSKDVLSLKGDKIFQAIKKSCKIKLIFTDRDFKENRMRMVLNFGHTFAHAIEAKNKYSRKINHGEAVLLGMMIALEFSFFKKICSKESYQEIREIYKNYNLIKNFSKFLKANQIASTIKYMSNDKKNSDSKINLILLKKIGQTTEPEKFKFSQIEIKKIVKKLF